MIHLDNVTSIIEELRAYDTEREWFEFNALSNSAAIDGKKYAYFVWGIHDETHEVVGTSFNCNQDVNHEPLKHFIARQLYPLHS